MPHLTVEYTANITGFDPLPALRAINRALVATGEFQEIDIKSRARCIDEFIIGTAEDQRGFVHARLAILSGRSDDTRRAVSGTLLEALQAAVPAVPGLHLQLCAEIVDIDRGSYAKSAREAA